MTHAADQPGIVVIGEALVDVIDRRDLGGDVEEHVGGSPANVAMGLARLDHRVELVTCLGDDERGERVTEHLRRHGVELGEDSVRASSTSTAEATIAQDGSASYVFDIDWRPDLSSLTGSTGAHVHTGSLATVLGPGDEDVLTALRVLAQTGTISYDPNIRPAVVGDPGELVARVEEVVALSTVVKASDEDLDLLYPGVPPEEVLRRWRDDLGCPVTVVTTGAKGVSWASRDGAWGQAPTQAREVVDTVGAGDSFMAGLLSGLLDAGALGDVARAATAGDDQLRSAVERGLATSGITVGHAGAYAPTRSELP